MKPQQMGETQLGLLAKMLRKIEFFSSLKVAQLEDMLPYIMLFSGNSGDTIFKQGDVGDACYMDIAGATDNFADAVFPSDAAIAANDILIGKMIALDIEETTRAWILIQPGWIYSATLGWV